MTRFLQFCRDYPVTVLCVVVCVVLFGVTTKPRQTVQQRLELLDRLGAVIERPVLADTPRGVVLFRGPLALWQGELWRIPVCAFHHVDLFHLIANSLTMLYLGRLLERRWGSWRMIQYLPAVVLFPLIPEFLAGNYVLGFSGVICAIFGTLCVLRSQDESLSAELPPETVQLGGAVLVLGVIFSGLGWMPIANLAHLTGFLWGALVGCVVTGLPWGRNRARGLRWLVIVLSLSSLWWVMHPMRVGNYHWYLALLEKSPARRSLELQKTVQLQPDAIGAWQMLAADQLRAGDVLAAWKVVLQGISHNPNDATLMKLARIIWLKIVIHPGRAVAEQILVDVFGDHAASWSDQFRSNTIWEKTWDKLQEVLDPMVAFPLRQKIDLELPSLPDEQFPTSPHPLLEDAVEGRSL